MDKLKLKEAIVNMRINTPPYDYDTIKLLSNVIDYIDDSILVIDHTGRVCNSVFTFSHSEIKDPVDCGVHMLKPCIHKYFKDHNYNESTSKVEKQMAIVALCHRIEEGLIDYLDELEEFNS